VAGIAGDFLVIPNPYGWLGEATATMKGVTLGISAVTNLPAQLTGSVVLPDALPGREAVDANLALATQQWGGPNRVFAQLHGLEVSVNQLGRSNSTTDPTTGWTAAIHYEPDAPIQNATGTPLGTGKVLSLDWRSAVQRPLNVQFGDQQQQAVNLTIDEMPLTLSQAKVSVLKQTDLQYYAVHWPGEQAVERVHGNVGDFPINIETPPTEFDFSAKVTNQAKNGAQWNYVDVALRGTRSEPSTRTNLNFDLKGVQFDFKHLDDNLDIHFAKEEVASEEVKSLLLNADSSADESLLPRFSLVVANPTSDRSDVMGAVVARAVIEKPGEFRVEVQGLRSARIDTTEVANAPGSNGYDIEFGAGGKVAINTSTAKGDYGLALDGGCIKLTGHLLLTKSTRESQIGLNRGTRESSEGDVGFNAVPFSCSSAVAGGPVSFALSKNGEQAIRFTKMVSISVSFQLTEHEYTPYSSTEPVKQYGKEKTVKAVGVFNDGDLLVDMKPLNKKKTTIQAHHLQQLEYTGTDNKGTAYDGSNIKYYKNHKINWAVAASSGRLDLDYANKNGLVELEAHVVAGATSDHVQFVPEHFAEMDCDNDDFSLDRAGQAEKRCRGKFVFCTIGPNAAACGSKSTEALIEELQYAI
jgi:hypothetical protein